MGILSPLVGKSRAKVFSCNMKRSKGMEVVFTLLDQALNLTLLCSNFTHFNLHTEIFWQVSSVGIKGANVRVLAV